MHRAIRNKRIIGSGCKLVVKANHSMIEGFDVDSSHRTIPQSCSEILQGCKPRSQSNDHGETVLVMGIQSTD